MAVAEVPGTDLLWPGDHRAGPLLGDAAFLDACLQVEAAWSAALAATGIAPAGAAVTVEDLRVLLDDADHERLAVDAEADGTPVAALVRLLRGRLGPDTTRSVWLHRGLTSQDVVDSALVLCARDAMHAVRADLREQVRLLSRLVADHRGTPVVARTLTQHAVPTTFGLRAGQWLTAVLDAHDDVAQLRWRAQLGGAAGTMAAAVQLADHLPDPVSAVAGPGGATADAADRLGLTASVPWHTVRTDVTRLADTAVRCTDAWARTANDVLVQGRPELGELSEGAGGGSSTMPHKANPVLSLLVRRTALAAPGLAATLHVASADSGEERAAGAWHVEWSTLRTLLRRTVVAASQATDLIGGLQVHGDRMAATLHAAEGAVRSEQRAMAEVAGRRATAGYDGAAGRYVAALLDRASAVLAGADA